MRVYVSFCLCPFGGCARDTCKYECSQGTSGAGLGILDTESSPQKLLIGGGVGGQNKLITPEPDTPNTKAASRTSLGKTFAGPLPGKAVGSAAGDVYM